MKKKVYISAFVRGNLGDDLFIKILCERYPYTQFYISDLGFYKHIFSDIKNLTYISHTDRTIKKFLYYRFKSINIEIPSLLYPPKADAHVEIGGSIFLELPYWEQVYEQRMTFLKRYKKIYTIGANWGPYQSKNFVDTYIKYLEKLEDLCFRDTYSYDLFKDLPNTRRADDVVFQLKHPQGEDKNYYVISPIDFTNRTELTVQKETYVQKIAEISNTLTSQGFEVILMGFCTFQKDDKAIEDIYTLINNKEKVSIYNHDNINTSLDIIANAKGIIATRFHAMILGFVFSKPTIPLIYSKKMLSVLEDMHFSDAFYNLEKVQDINAEDLVKNILQMKPVNIERMRISSEEQFKELDKFLLKK